MAHKTGAAFADYGAHIIHGAANAMYLPKVIAFNAKDETAKKRYGEIADFMGLGGDTLDEKVALLIAYLRKMNDDLESVLHQKLWRRQLSDRTGIRSGRSILRETAGDRSQCNLRCVHRLQSKTAEPGRDGEAVEVLLL